MSPHLPILREVFGYDAFRGPQQAIVDHVVKGGDALVLMPTGGGKSLCFQLPALVRYQRRGVLTIVISPLQALMKDQVDNLKAKGIKASAIYSGMSYRAGGPAASRKNIGWFTASQDQAMRRFWRSRLVGFIIEGTENRGLLPLSEVKRKKPVAVLALRLGS
mgnify:CR=1 FL=1